MQSLPRENQVTHRTHRGKDDKTSIITDDYRSKDDREPTANELNEQLGLAGILSRSITNLVQLQDVTPNSSRRSRPLFSNSESLSSIELLSSLDNVQLPKEGAYEKARDGSGVENCYAIVTTLFDVLRDVEISPKNQETATGSLFRNQFLQFVETATERFCRYWNGQDAPLPVGRRQKFASQSRGTLLTAECSNDTGQKVAEPVVVVEMRRMQIVRNFSTFKKQFYGVVIPFMLQYCGLYHGNKFAQQYLKEKGLQFVPSPSGAKQICLFK